MEVAQTILTALGLSTASIAVALALLAAIGFLTKFWAERLLEADRSLYAREIEALRTQAEEQLERLKAAEQKGLHVHRVQFETEFRAYQEIWKALSDAILATLKLRPMMDYQDPDESEDQRKARKMVEYGEKVTACKITIRQFYPFLPKPVTTEIETLLQLFSKEQLEFEGGPKEFAKPSEYWKSARDNQEEIMKQSDQVRDAIQKRIGLLEIIA